jgi:hypothetical protein
MAVLIVALLLETANKEIHIKLASASELVSTEHMLIDKVQLFSFAV